MPENRGVGDFLRHSVVGLIVVCALQLCNVQRTQLTLISELNSLLVRIRILANNNGSNQSEAKQPRLNDKHCTVS